MANVFTGDDGYTYALVPYAGKEWQLWAGGTKLTVYEQYGAVFVGAGFSFTMPDGETLDGYTNEPVFVDAYREMWDYSARLLTEARQGQS